MKEAVMIEPRDVERRARACHDHAIDRAISFLGGRVLADGPVAGLVMGFRPLETCIIDALGRALARVRTQVIGRDDVETETVLYAAARATPWRC